MNIKRTLTILVLFVVTLQTTSCATFRNIDPNTSFDAGSKDGLVIFGVSPRYIVFAWKGSHTTDGVNKLDPSELSVISSPRSGYIVKTVSPTSDDQAYALYKVMTKWGGWPKSTIFEACNNAKAANFQARPGEVIYLGDFQYQLVNGRLYVTHTVNLDGAKTHLKEKYPGVQIDPVYVEPVWLPVEGNSCGFETEDFGFISFPRLLHISQLPAGIGVKFRKGRFKTAAKLLEVDPKGTAAQANLLPGDLVVRVNGRSIMGLTPAVSVAEQIRGEPGTSVTLDVVRGTYQFTVNIVRRALEIHVDGAE
ncbi:MAG: PDZ domain-containing protein [Betaproteobacteria bacterium]|nr:PDZ domain-containing protein [Betaproteobacteria bacterium]